MEQCSVTSAIYFTLTPLPAETPEIHATQRSPVRRLKKYCSPTELY
jgi:hypothetical protein